MIFYVGQDAAEYHHKAYAAHEASSLGALGQFDIQFQPEYQRVRLHRLALLRGKQVIDKLASADIRFLQRENVDLAIKERDEKLRKLVLPQQSASTRTIEGATGDAYACMVEFGEGYRRLLDDHRRLLAFVAERSGKVLYEDGKLLFTCDADLVLACELFNKLDATRVELNTIVERQIKKELDAESRQRGERVEPAPTDKT
ncbi:MAG: DUF3857 domain-containing protein [Pseudomonadota bacterium]